MEQVSETTITKCPGCGAEMKYDIASGNLKCQHCGNEQIIQADDSVWRRQLSADIMSSKSNWGDGQVVRCSNCGSKEVLDNKSINKICSFCGSTSVIATGELCGIKPDGIIPFKVAKEQGSALFQKWMKSHWFAPRAFKRSDIRENLNQIYAPSWSFTSSVVSLYAGVLGRTVTETRRNANGSTYTTSRTHYFRVNGQMTKHYADFLVQSSDRISPVNFEKIKPFDIKELKPYRTEFLSGIITEHYTKDLDICFGEFTNHIKRDLQRDIMRRHGADTVQSLNIELDFPTKEFNYILLPLYFANYTYKEKTYNFYINGISGKIVGKYPKSVWKILFVTFLPVFVFALAGLGYYLSTILQ